MRRKSKQFFCGFLLLCVLSPPASQAAQRKLIPLGIPAGVQMTANGVVVSDFTDVESAAGTVCPAKQAGIQAGDVLESVNGKALKSSEQFVQEVTQGGGKPVRLAGVRGETAISVTVQPVKSAADGSYKLGLLVRDSMAGIGTITYVDPATGAFGMLGHAVCDSDTGSRMPLREGRLLRADVVGVVRGVSGEPGELVGAFDRQHAVGELSANTKSGLFGILTDSSVYASRQSVFAAQTGEVRTGDAAILTCTDGNIPKQYTISIEKINAGSSNGRDLTIRVTDEQLLNTTGGIVPGMSGSPILQNGKLVGAVTHVLVDNPAKGYGILIADMLDAAE